MEMKDAEACDYVGNTLKYSHSEMSDDHFDRTVTRIRLIKHRSSSSLRHLNMCIVLVARTRNYTILISNRDEFLARPTFRVSFWPHPLSHILSGRDCARETHGTWLGITRSGRVAILTNFRETTEEKAKAAVSRGEITKEFLASDKAVEEWIGEVLRSGIYKDVGGFSSMCGILHGPSDGFVVVSNRSSLDSGVDYILQDNSEGQCEGLSNSLFHEEWPKVKLGRKLLAQLTKDDIKDEEVFIERCFEILSYVLGGY
jgi:uncharacterized protein with NRDE domain